MLAQATDSTSTSLPNQDDIDSSQLASYHRRDILLRFSVEYLMTVGGGWGASTELHERQTQVLDIERLKKRTLHRKVFPGSLKMAPYCRIWQVRGSKSDVYSSALCCRHVLSEVAMKEMCVRCLAVTRLAKWQRREQFKRELFCLYRPPSRGECKTPVEGKALMAHTVKTQ